MAKEPSSKKGDAFQEVDINADEPIYTTGVVRRLLGIPIWVLKRLDAAGIVRPPRKDTSRSRLYSKRELKAVQRAWNHLKRGVNVSGLKVILKLEDEAREREKKG